MAERLRLNPKVKIIWLLPATTLLTVLLLVGFLGFLLTRNASFFGITEFNFFYILPLLAVIIWAITYAWVELIYRNFTYELDENEIVVRQGVLDRQTTVIPYAAIQDITTIRSVVERLLKIATIEIETAGSMRLASEITLPGIAEKDLFVRELTHRVERAKGHPGSQGHAHADLEKELLSEILTELKAIDSHLALQEKTAGKAGKPEQKEEPETGKPPTAFEKYEEFKGGGVSS